MPPVDVVDSKLIRRTFGIQPNAATKWVAAGLLKPIDSSRITRGYQYLVADLNELLRDSAIYGWDTNPDFLALAERPGETIISSAQTAKMLNCKLAAIAKLARDGRLKAYQIRMNLYVLASSAEELQSENRRIAATSTTHAKAATYLCCENSTIVDMVGYGLLEPVQTLAGGYKKRVSAESLIKLLEVRLHGQTAKEWIGKIKKCPETLTKKQLLRHLFVPSLLQQLVADGAMPYFTNADGTQIFWKGDVRILSEAIIIRKATLG